MSLFCTIQEAKVHMKRCIESGLWVPNSKTDDGDEKEEDATYEEVKQKEEETKKEWPTLIEWIVVSANVLTRCIATPLCVWLVCQSRNKEITSPKYLAKT